MAASPGGAGNLRHRSRFWVVDSFPGQALLGFGTRARRPLTFPITLHAHNPLMDWPGPLVRLARCTSRWRCADLMLAISHNALPRPCPPWGGASAVIALFKMRGSETRRSLEAERRDNGHQVSARMHTIVQQVDIRWRSCQHHGRENTSSIWFRRGVESIF
jgi:hypothetical protein